MQDSKSDCLSRLAGRQAIDYVLSVSGAGPRSRCAGMIRGGRVAVDGKVVRDPETRVDPFREQVTLDGRGISTDRVCRYLLLNKPFGVLCAFSDPEGRPTLADYVDVPGVYAAGRLDLDSEGLLLLTNDGWLIHHLGHPRYQHAKTYLVQVERVPNEEALAMLRQGVVIKGKYTAPATAEVLVGEPDLPARPVPIRHSETVPVTWLRMVITEGKKRQIRRMTAVVGHPALRLVRVGIGPLQLGRLQPGEWRDLSDSELRALRGMLHSPNRNQ